MERDEGPSGSTQLEPSKPHHPRRPLDVRIFSSAADAPRARRPTDALLFVLAVLGIVALSIPAPGPTAIDTATANLVAELPGLVGWFWEIAYDLLILWSAVLLLLALFAPGRKRLFAYQVLAVGMALGFAVLGSVIGGTDACDESQGAHRLLVPTDVSRDPDRLRYRRSRGGFAAPRSAMEADRTLAHRDRSGVAGIALGAVLPIGVAAGFLIGFASAALVHLLVGSPGGRLSLAQVSDALGELGVETSELHEPELQPKGWRSPSRPRPMDARSS